MLNEFYTNIGIKEFLKRYGIKNALRRGFFMANPIHLVKDYEIKKMLWQKKASKKVKKYIQYRDLEPQDLFYGDQVFNDPIWMYWNSGLENAPEIVKKCYESIKSYSEREVILLTEKNVNEYVTFPEELLKKKKKGNLSMAVFSDLLRFALLTQYGGTWIDSTVYLTDNLPKQIMDSDFFVFQNSMGLISNPVLCAVWFIRAKKNNEIIKMIRNVAFAYWMKENHVEEYLTSNIIITEIMKVKENGFLEMPYMNSDYSEYLIKIIGEEFTESKYEEIKKLTSIHKLTYKLAAAVDKEKSFYRHIIS